MTEKQLIELERFLEDGIYAETKDTDSDIIKLLSMLKSLGLIKKKLNSPTLEIIDLISFEKLIELKSISDFKKWYSDKDKNITNFDFSGSTIGQFNQSDDLSILKTEIKQVIHPSAKEKQQNAIISFVVKFWWQILIPLLVGIILLAIQQKWFT